MRWALPFFISVSLRGKGCDTAIYCVYRDDGISSGVLGIIKTTVVSFRSAYLQGKQYMKGTQYYNIAFSEIYGKLVVIF